jgi:hypothetical protein
MTFLLRGARLSETGRKSRASRGASGGRGRPLPIVDRQKAPRGVAASVESM